MVKLATTFGRLNSVKVMVIGDLLLDTYTIGKARRISPEAPVAIVHVQHEEHRPGGAGNVVLNLLSLGAHVVSIGRVGNDRAGECLCQALINEGVSTHSIFVQDNYKTPVKNRIIAENQQIVRIDHEHVVALPEQLEQVIIESLPHLMQDVKMIAISDYGKGFLTPTLLTAMMQHAKEAKIAVITDPKGQDFAKYRGCSIIKPNLSEAYAAANLPLHAPLEMVASRVLDLTQATMLMVTRSEAGISIFHANGMRLDFPVHIKQVKDVTGAGDTVLAMLTCALANDLSIEEAAQLCNVAAGIAIERMGCARVTLSDLAHRLLETDVSNKVFDEEHLFALLEVLKAKSFVFLALSHFTHVHAAFFKTMQQLASQADHLLIYLADAQVDDNLIDILASFKEVSFILLHAQSLRRLCEQVHPSGSYHYDGKNLAVIKEMDQLFETAAERAT